VRNFVKLVEPLQVPDVVSRRPGFGDGGEVDEEQVEPMHVDEPASVLLLAEPRQGELSGSGQVQERVFGAKVLGWVVKSDWVFLEGAQALVEAAPGL
jgi:hypothetical protein